MIVIGCWFVTDHYIGMLIWFFRFQFVVRNRKCRYGGEKKVFQTKRQNCVGMWFTAIVDLSSSYRGVFHEQRVKMEFVSSLMHHNTNFTTHKQFAYDEQTPEIAVHRFIRSNEISFASFYPGATRFSSGNFCGAISFGSIRRIQRLFSGTGNYFCRGCLWN